MRYVTFESYFEWINTKVFDNPKFGQLEHVVENPKLYSCFKGLTMEQANKVANQYNCKIELNTEPCMFPETHPWVFSRIKLKE